MIAKPVKRTLKRYSLVVGLLLIIYLSIKVVNTANLCLAYQPSDVQEVPPENMYTDAWKQTIGYWGNNLGVGGSYFWNPLSGLSRMFWVAYDQTNSNFFDHYARGAGEVWGRLATINVHGALESTGILLMAVAGVLFWILTIGVIWLALKALAKKVVSSISIPVNRVGPPIVKLFGDLVVLFFVGVSLVIIAAPIEAYISWPNILPVFTGHLWLSLIYLAFLYMLVIWLFFVRLAGYNQMRMAGKGTKLLIKRLRN